MPPDAVAELLERSTTPLPLSTSAFPPAAASAPPPASASEPSSAMFSTVATPVTSSFSTDALSGALTCAAAELPATLTSLSPSTEASPITLRTPPPSAAAMPPDAEAELPERSTAPLALTIVTGPLMAAAAPPPASETEDSTLRVPVSVPPLAPSRSTLAVTSPDSAATARLPLITMSLSAARSMPKIDASPPPSPALTPPSRVSHAGGMKPRIPNTSLRATEPEARLSVIVTAPFTGLSAKGAKDTAPPPMSG